MKMRVKATPLGSFGTDLRERRKVMGAAAREVAATAKALLRQGQGTGRVYFNSGGNRYKPYLRGKHQASAPGAPPATQTGYLSNKIKGIAFKSGGGFAVRDGAFYAASLEYGAKGGSQGKARVLQPRPYLEPALQKKWPTISRKIIQALENGVKYTRDRK